MVAKKAKVRKAPAKRVRRSAEEAREQILDAAERMLASAGPSGIRLQELAADIGVSHPTILHHFGSREALVEAVVQRALEGLQRDVGQAILAKDFEAEQATEIVARVMQTLADRGHARLLAWLALEGRSKYDEGRMLAALARAMHGRRKEETGKDAPYEDTLFAVVLFSLALFAEGLLGEATWSSAGLGSDRGAPKRFRRWLVDLVQRHFHA